MLRIINVFSEISWEGFQKNTADVPNFRFLSGFSEVGMLRQCVGFVGMGSI
jgi:hypothetical protein